MEIHPTFYRVEYWEPTSEGFDLAEVKYFDNKEEAFNQATAWKLDAPNVEEGTTIKVCDRNGTCALYLVMEEDWVEAGDSWEL